MLGEQKDKEPFEEMTDERLIEVYRQGQLEAIEILVQRYKQYVRQKIRSNYFVGADKEDLIQEGMIGLFKAICDYDATKETRFKSFATLCITRQISTAFKTATRQKHMMLNNSVSLHAPVGSGEEGITLMDTLKASQVGNPEALVIAQEDVEDFKIHIKQALSSLEWEVLGYHMAGKDYHEIAKMMDKPSKSIDNALQRIKRKVSDVMKKNNA